MNDSPDSPNPKGTRALPAAPKKRRVELRLLTLPDDPPALQVYGTPPGEFFRECDLYFNNYYDYTPIISLNEFDTVDQLLKIIRTARKFGIAVTYMSDESTTGFELKPVVRQCVDQIILKHNGKHKITVHHKCVDTEMQEWLPITPIDHQHWLFNDGTIGQIEENPLDSVLHSMRYDELYYNLKGDVKGVQAKAFNQHSISHPLPAHCLKPPYTQFYFGSEERALPSDPEALPAASLSLKIVSEDAFNCCVRLVLHYGKHALSLETLDDTFSQFMQGEATQSRLMHAKTRIRLLTQTAMELHVIDKDEHQAIIERVSAQDCFQHLGLRDKALQFLKAYRKNWAHPSAAKKRRLVVIPGDAVPWHLVNIPIDAYAHLTLCIRQPVDNRELSKLGGRMHLPKVDLADFVERVAATAGFWNVPITLDDKPIDKAPISIAVNVSEHADIDWFELKAEIRCGKLAIPQEQWEQLIRGNLLLEKDGRATLIQVSSREAIQRIQDMLAPKQRQRSNRSGADAVIESVPKLKILDWIELRKIGVSVNLPKPIEKIFHSLSHFEGIPDRKLPSISNAELRDYQKNGYYWLTFLYEHRFGACLADDMGLGKTLQTITFLAAIKEGIVQFSHSETQKNQPALPHLVVLPPSLLFNWRSEIERFYPAFTVTEYLGNVRLLADAMRAEIVLTTYDIVRRDSEQFAQAAFDVVVFDETQLLKNIVASRTKAALKLKRNFTLCLTGTPLENHVGEYYSIMNLALPGLMGDYKSFRSALNRGDTTALNRTRPFILRRTKANILTELPPKQEQDIYLDMSELQKEVYTRVVGEIREEVLSAYEDKPQAQAGIIALTALTRLRQVCVGVELLGQQPGSLAPKFEYLLDTLSELREEGHCAVVFSQYTRALDQLEQAAQERGLPHLRMDGKTPTQKRKQLVESFQNDSEVKFFFISLKTGGVGLNLTRANYVFHLDPWWNPAVENQASDRAHRIGQTRTVFIQRLLMRQTIEEKMMELKRRKQKLFEQVLNPAEAAGKQSTTITAADISFLLN